uniref:Uncharacterized protein n=1 Tax=Arundo donax TaxID=35708 RepID=A0A0A9CZB6_ARUDO
MGLETRFMAPSCFIRCNLVLLTPSCSATSFIVLRLDIGISRSFDTSTSIFLRPHLDLPLETSTRIP